MLIEIKYEIQNLFNKKKRTTFKGVLFVEIN